MLKIPILEWAISQCLKHWTETEEGEQTLQQEAPSQLVQLMEKC